MRQLPFVIGLALLGCTRSASPTPTLEPLPSASPPTLTASASASPSASSSAASVMPVRTPAAVVWLVRNKAFHSVWIEPGAGGPVVKRERAEPVVATSRGLFAYRTEMEKVKVCPSCGPCPKGRCSEPEQDIGVGTVVLLPAGPSKQLGFYPSPGGCADEQQLSAAEGGAVLRGALGSVIFVSVHGMQQGCGAAHPMWSWTEIVLDLDTDKDVDVSPPPAALARLAAIAKRKIRGVYGDDAGCISEGAEAEPFTAALTYDPRGVLRAKYTFTMSSNYMCGTGPGHYTVAEDVFDSALPTAVEPLRRAPAWLVPYLEKHPSVGVSVLPPSLDRAAAIAAFEGPLPRASVKKASP